MPANIITAETGGRWKVEGIRMATVAVGPIPGSTPMSVPTKTPTKQKRIFVRLKLTEKPR
jgi:hypothetical protein